MAEMLNFLLFMFTLLILARVLMSWVQIDPYHPVAQFIFQATEPFLKPVREVLPPAGGFDFSPIVLLILVQVVGNIIISGFR